MTSRPASTACRSGLGSSGVTLAVLLISGWTTLAMAAPAAYPEGSCWQLAEQYIGAKPDAAVQLLTQWSDRELESKCGPPEAPVELRLKAAVALLLTEAGLKKRVFGATRPELRVINGSLSEREVHFRTAYQFVDLIYRQAAKAGNKTLLDFCRRWYVQSFHAGGDLVRNIAQIRFADDSEVAVLLGAWEVQMMGPEVNDGPAQRLPGLDGGVMLTSSHGRFAADSAAKAERWFRRALEFNPQFYMARLHLGRLMFTLDKVDEAKSELERTLFEASGSNDAFAIYLAGLFLGQLHERAKRDDLALQMYRRATIALPDGQAAVLALARLLISRGNSSDGWAEVRAMLEINRGKSGLSRDPWQYFRYSRNAVWDSERRFAEMRQLLRE